MANLLVALCLAWAGFSHTSGVRTVNRQRHDSSAIEDVEVEERAPAVLDLPRSEEGDGSVLEEMEASQTRAGARRRRRRRCQGSWDKGGGCGGSGSRPSPPSPRPSPSPPSPGPSPSPSTCTYKTGGGAVTWGAFGGVNKGSGPLKINSRAEVGDHEFVAIGGSRGGSTSNESVPWNKAIMINEGFKLVVIRGPDDRKASLWHRTSKGGGNVFIPGKAKDNPYTIFTVKGNLKMNNVKTANVKAASNSRAELKNPGGSGLTIGVFFFDDSFKLDEAPNGGDILCRNWGYGDADGFAVVLYQPGKAPPSKFPITRMKSGGGSQYITLTAVIPVR